MSLFRNMVLVPKDAANSQDLKLFEVKTEKQRNLFFTAKFVK